METELMNLQVSSMVNQVVEMFPQVSVDTIRQLINNTGSVTATIDTLLEGNAQMAEVANNANADNNQQGQPPSDASSDETSEAFEDDTQSEAEEVLPQRHALQQQQPTFSGNLLQKTSNLPIKTKNDWLNKQMELMVAMNRRLILEK
jgi:hypothetical protein